MFFSLLWKIMLLYWINWIFMATFASATNISILLLLFQWKSDKHKSISNTQFGVKAYWKFNNFSIISSRRKFLETWILKLKRDFSFQPIYKVNIPSLLWKAGSILIWRFSHLSMSFTRTNCFFFRKLENPGVCLQILEFHFEGKYLLC